MTPTGPQRNPLPGDARAPRPRALGGFLTIVAFLMLIWLGFSNKRDLFHLATGLGSALAVAAMTHGLLAIGVRRDRRGRVAVRYVFTFRWHRLFVFVPWLLWKILAANVQVAWLILHPKMPIDPAIIRIKTGLRGDLSRMALATAITVTPGTCVLDIVGDEVVIHKIHPVAAEDIPTRVVAMVRWVFEPGEDEEVPLPGPKPAGDKELPRV
jgi:multicomponent Na+:H+ antiporter subunit E